MKEKREKHSRLSYMSKIPGRCMRFCAIRVWQRKRPANTVQCGTALSFGVSRKGRIDWLISDRRDSHRWRYVTLR